MSVRRSKKLALSIVWRSTETRSLIETGSPVERIAPGRRDERNEHLTRRYRYASQPREVGRPGEVTHRVDVDPPVQGTGKRAAEVMRRALQDLVFHDFSPPPTPWSYSSNDMKTLFGSGL